MFKSCRKDQYINPLTWLHDSSVLHTPLHATISLPHTEKGVEINLSLYLFLDVLCFHSTSYHLSLDFWWCTLCIRGHKQPKHGQHLSCRFQTSLTSPFKQCSPPIGTRTTQCRQYHIYKKQHPPWSKDVISADLYPRIVIAHVRSYYLIPYPSQKRIWLHLILTTWIW